MVDNLILMLPNEWNIRTLYEDDLDLVGGWINTLSGVPTGNRLQIINLLKMERLAGLASGRVSYYLVCLGNEPVLHVTMANWQDSSIILFVLMNPTYDDDEMYWQQSWRTALDFFNSAITDLTHLRVRVAQEDELQIKVLEQAGFRSSDIPGEYAYNASTWTGI